MVKDPQARISKKQAWKDYFLFALKSPSIATQAQPGQFLMVKVSDGHPYPLLRRPLSIHSRDKKMIEVFFKVAGTGTALLAQKKVGESLDILGPLGKGFRLDESLKGKKLFAVGGGRGIAPLYFLVQELRSLGVSIKIFYGGQTHEDLPLREKFEKSGINTAYSTDDGSFGFKGFVTGLLEADLRKMVPDKIYACGPEAMLEKIAQISKKRNIPAEFSLESLMGCGFGACWGCVKRIKKGEKEGWVKVCEEGPVFSADEIIWPRREEK
jgi:dihydroorotate dehydrogenase electron transfer subunit